MDLEELRQACLSCTRCGLCETRTNVVFGVGAPDAGEKLPGKRVQPQQCDICWGCGL